ncbi:MAG: hypothetical protein ACOYU4_05090 [Thermodesulfobacteriota bacterium]
MKKHLIVGLILGGVVVLGMTVLSLAQEMKKEDCFFSSSLHATAGGMSYWYDKSNGGLEIVTGVPWKSPPAG